MLANLSSFWTGHLQVVLEVGRLQMLLSSVSIDSLGRKGMGLVTSAYPSVEPHIETA